MTTHKTENIDNLKELFESINNKFSETKTLKNCKEILECYNGTDWQKYISFSDETYKRNVISDMTNDNFEFVLICWKPMQESPIHDHPDNGCLVKILQGTLQEEIYLNEKNENEENNINNIYKHIESKINRVGDISYMEKMSLIHKISNPNKEFPSISLHIYSPPKFKTTIFKIKHDLFE